MIYMIERGRIVEKEKQKGWREDGDYERRKKKNLGSDYYLLCWTRINREEIVCISVFVFLRKEKEIPIIIQSV